MAHPCPTLETYKYQMPGEKEAPIKHLYLFDLVDINRTEIKVAAYKDQSFGLEYKPLMQKQRDMENQAVVWQGDNNRFFLTRSSRDLHRIDVGPYPIGQDSVVPVLKDRMIPFQEPRPLRVLIGGHEFFHCIGA